MDKKDYEGNVSKVDKIKAYMRMAKEMSILSPDMETKVGAIMLSSDSRIIASSLNGFLRGAPDDDLPAVRPVKYEFIQHAERNLIYNCAYEGIRTKDTTIICTLSPCLECLRACFQAGVKTIIFNKLYHKFDGVDFYEKLPDVKVKVSTIAGYFRLDMERMDGKDS